MLLKCLTVLDNERRNGKFKDIEGVFGSRRNRNN
jgi:hypothetical protein